MLYYFLWTSWLIAHGKLVSTSAAITAGIIAAALSGAEIATIMVAVVTTGGVAFSSITSARADRIEKAHAHEDTELAHLRRLRNEMLETEDRLRDENAELQISEVSLRIGVRILTAQIRALGETPAWTREDLEG